MTLHEQITDILASAVEAQECAGISVLVRRCGEEMLYTQAGMSDVASGRLIHRDSIFRLYSQSKPITAAAVMLLAERGQIDLMDGVDRYLPGFRNARVVDKQGTIRPATRAPWLMELLGMTAGVCYPDSDPAGQYAAKVFDEATQEILAGGGVPTVEFCNRLGQQPLSFQPGTHWRYSTCADILGAVVEVVSGMRFGEFLRKEFFEPLDMVDTGFYVPESKRNRLVTAYKRTENGLCRGQAPTLPSVFTTANPPLNPAARGLFRRWRITATLPICCWRAALTRGGGFSRPQQSPA